jgi:hypothetical protein
MHRTVETIARFFRLAFWPLCASVLVVLLLQPLYFLSLASLGTLAPRERTVAHLNAAFAQGVLADDGAPRALLWKGGEQLTECISLGIGLNKAENAWQSAISGAYPMVGNTHACTGLHRAVAGEPVTWQPYFRYWHGYRVILAPLIALFPLWFIKLLNALMVAAACGALARTLCARCGGAVAFIVVATFLCLSDVLFIWRTSTHSLSLAYILAGSCLFAAALKRQWRAGGLMILAAVLGSAFNFIDFLINPPMMPMLIAFFVLIDGRRGMGLLALACTIAWFGGYAETWFAKWLIAYWAMPASANVFADVLGTIENRTVGALNGVYLFPLAATLRAFLRALSRVGVIVPIVIALAVAHYTATVSRIDWRRALWLASPLLLAVVWFEALSSHTQYHLTVSSRSAAMGLAIALAAAVLSMPQRPSLADIRLHVGLMTTKLRRIAARRPR